MEMGVNYMNNVFGGVFGMEIVDEVIIEGHALHQIKQKQLLLKV